MTTTAKPLPTITEIADCLEEARKELARNEPRGNWWAEVHLRDAANELTKLRRLVAKLPREC